MVPSLPQSLVKIGRMSASLARAPAFSDAEFPAKKIMKGPKVQLNARALGAGAARASTAARGARKRNLAISTRSASPSPEPEA